MGTNALRNGSSYVKAHKANAELVTPVNEEVDYIFDLELPHDLSVVDESCESKYDMSVDGSESDINKFTDTILTNGVSIDGIQSLIEGHPGDHYDNPEGYADTIQILRQALSSALTSHQSFVAKVMDKEKKDHKKRSELRKTVKRLEDEKKESSERQDQVWSTLSLAKKREEDLNDEIRRLRDKLDDTEKTKQGAQIELGVSRAREKKSRKIASEYSAELQKIQKELLQHGGGSAKDTLVSDLKDEMSSKESKIKELESQLKLREQQIDTAKKEKEAASERADSTEKDMFELMRNLGDMQRSGEARESEANELRKRAEEKAALMERSLAEAKEKLAAIDVEQKTTQGTVESIKKELMESRDLIVEMKNREKLLKSDLNTAGAQLKVEQELRTRSEQKENEEKTERVAMSAQLMALTKDHARMEAHLAECNEAMELKWGEKLNEQTRICELKENQLGESQQKIAGLEGEIETLKMALKDVKGGMIEGTDQTEQLRKLNGEIAATKEKLKLEEQRCIAIEERYKGRIKVLEEEIRKGQAERRKLHNEVQELRGNVRVFARIRPFLPGDGVDDDARPCVAHSGENGLKLRRGEDEPWKHNFTFDEVFPQTAGQEAVFNQASEFIQSAMDGYNVCLFSYGQTGSGKTHTMQGSGVGQMRGIIPRSIEQIGRDKTRLEHDGWSYEMNVSYLEIYNESIRDLLRDDRYEEIKHEVKVDKDGKRFVSNMTMKPLDPNDDDAVESIIRQAAKCRSVASTGMNAVSSRSHAVFTLHLSAVHPDDGKSIQGQLNLVDLAGSERIERSGASGDRAKEAMAINKSLSALTDVFAAIGRKGGHVPYRNSKLTYLLQPCLSGDGKTLMLVNLSPTEESSQESLCSLRFAAQVNKCELGKAKRSIGDLSAADDDGSKTTGSSARSVNREDSCTSTSLSSQSSSVGRSRSSRLQKPAGSLRRTASRGGSPTGESVRSLGSSRSASSRSLRSTKSSPSLSTRSKVVNSRARLSSPRT